MSLCLCALFFGHFFCFLGLYFRFFFFKQKTAYEMRISDWSSDVCPSDLVIRSYAPGFIFTTSLSPVLVAGVLASVRHLKQSSVERDAQQAAATYLKQSFRDAGLPVMNSTTHIVPLMIGDPVRAKKVSDILLAEYGVYVQPINFPTVPRGTERLRFTPGPTHDEAMMRELTTALVEIWSRPDLELQKGDGSITPA